MTKGNKMQFFQSLLRDQANEYWQAITIKSGTTLTDIVALFRKNWRTCPKGHERSGKVQFYSSQVLPNKRDIQ